MRDNEPKKNPPTAPHACVQYNLQGQDDEEILLNQTGPSVSSFLPQRSDGGHLEKSISEH